MHSFLFISEVVCLNLDGDKPEITTAFFYNPADPAHTYLLDHFCERQVLPGVILAEIMAQSSGILYFALKGVPKEFASKKYRHLTFSKMVVPGTLVYCTSHLSRQRGSFAEFQVAVTNYERTVIYAEAEYILFACYENVLSSVPAK